ncbi:MAG: universal stress protein [Deltaproteobacteria bacterium]|nr:universal stress protein [Deltaproteobacteria bacterium]
MSDEIHFYPIKKILLPTDGSTFSIQAARYAAKVANKHNSKITILHVMDVDFPRQSSYEPIELDDLDSVVIGIEHSTEIKDRAIKIVNETKKILTTMNISCDTEYYLFGNIPEIIVNTAKEENFDLIIIGHKGLTGLKHAMMGSVAERVCHIAPCPVLIIR